MIKKGFLVLLFVVAYLGTTSAQILEHYVKVGTYMLYSGEVNYAFESFSRGVRYNNLDSRFFLAQCYENGYGTQQNLQEAFNQYRKAAEGGNDRAKAISSEMLIHGIGTQKNTTKAKYWLEKLLMNKTPEGYFLKGLCLLEGEIYKQNTVEALDNLQKAINAGNIDACLYLAKKLVEGECLSPDRQKALELMDYVCGLYPTNILLQDKKGSILLDSGDDEGAKTLWQQLTTLSPAYAVEFQSSFANTMRAKYAVSATSKKKYDESRAQMLALIDGGDPNLTTPAPSYTYTRNTSQQVIVQQPVFAQQTPELQQQDKSVNIITTPSNEPEDNKITKETTAEISDVDKNIPNNQTINDKTFAIIIANENYQDVNRVTFANHDGEIFASYCKQTLGLPETNVHLIKDATLNNIKRELNWIKQVANAYGESMSLIFYYAGHGIPDEASRSAYLLPVDGFGTDITTGFPLSELYSTLGSIPSKSVIVCLDACFSGASRDGGMVLSARGVAIKPKAETPYGKMVVLSAAQGDETAYPYKEEGHGLFTYYLLKKLQETKGQATLGDISAYIIDNVTKKSIVANGKSQTPTVVSPAGMGGGWKNWKMY